MELLSYTTHFRNQTAAVILCPTSLAQVMVLDSKLLICVCVSRRPRLRRPLPEQPQEAQQEREREPLQLQPGETVTINGVTPSTSLYLFSIQFVVIKHFIYSFLCLSFCPFLFPFTENEHHARILRQRARNKAQDNRRALDVEAGHNAMQRHRPGFAYDEWDYGMGAWQPYFAVCDL